MTTLPLTHSKKSPEVSVGGTLKAARRSSRMLSAGGQLMKVITPLKPVGSGANPLSQPAKRRRLERSSTTLKCLKIMMRRSGSH